MPDRIIALIGKPAAGKTTIGKQLSEATDWPLLSIDDHGQPGSRRWNRLTRRLADTEGAVITESCLIQPGLRRILNDTPHLVIEITASEGVRRRRLRERGDTRMELTKPIPPADLIIPTGTPIDDIIKEIEEAGT